MKVHFDISHPAHLNFFKYSIRELQKQGHKVYISVLDRGRMISIARHEFPEVMIFKSGRHRGGIVSIFLEANILKFFRLLLFWVKTRPDVTLSCGGFVAGAIMKLTGRPNYQFDDDPERKNNVRLERLTADILFFPPIIQPFGNIKIYNGIKEWAYLSPTWFTPDISVLNEYNLISGEYIFVREVSRDTLNYMTQDKDPVIMAIVEATRGKKVLLSLEKKADRSLYPEEWIMLEEPVSDIHSLIFFSSMLISSGDSMAREACVLGVPAFYCGGRKMAVNDYLSSAGLFHDVKPAELAEKVGKLKGFGADRIHARQKMVKEWDDITLMTVNLVLDKK